MPAPKEGQPSLSQLWLATYTAVLTGRTSIPYGEHSVFYTFSDAVKEAIEAANYAVDSVKERA